MKRVLQHNPFDNINDKNVQYILGFICADGTIYDSKFAKNQIAIQIQRRDRELLEKMINIINPKIRIRDYQKFLKKTGKTYEYSIITFSYKEMYESMLNYGITPRKSFTLNLNIPITWDLLRGIIDGDGCLSLRHRMHNKTAGTWVRRISIYTGSIEFKNQICSFLSENNIKYNISFKKENLFAIEVSNGRSIITMLNNLYTDAQIYLQRKFEIAQQIRNNLIESSKFRELASRTLSQTFNLKENIDGKKCDIYNSMTSNRIGGAETIMGDPNK